MLTEDLNKLAGSRISMGAICNKALFLFFGGSKYAESKSVEGLEN